MSAHHNIERLVVCFTMVHLLIVTELHVCGHISSHSNETCGLSLILALPASSLFNSLGVATLHYTKVFTMMKVNLGTAQCLVCRVVGVQFFREFNVNQWLRDIH